MPDPKNTNNDVLAEQIKMLFEITKEIKQMLSDMTGKVVSVMEFQTVTKTIEDRVIKLESTNTWLARLVIGAIITALLALVIIYKQ